MRAMIYWQVGRNASDDEAVVADSVARLRGLVIAFALVLGVIFVRLAHLVMYQGAAYRAAAVRPVERQEWVNGSRGRILSRDGVELVRDRQQRGLAVAYRWFEEPANPRWLRSMARRKLTGRARRDPQQVAAAERTVLVERRKLAQRLAALAGVTDETWAARAQAVQTRVRRIADDVDRRRRQRTAQGATPVAGAHIVDGWLGVILGLLLPVESLSCTEGPLVIAEELATHRLVDELSLWAIAEIEAHPEQYPGTRIELHTVREYPQGPLAAHVLGYVGRPEGRAADSGAPRALDAPHATVGLAGVEQQYEPVLRSSAGCWIERIDTRGNMLARSCTQQPIPGRDVTLTLDSRLQRTAEELLASAAHRRLEVNPAGERSTRGGAIVAIDVHTGAIIAMASYPTFHPQALSGGDPQAWSQALADAGQPLFARAVAMALPPGSVIKPVTAAALLDQGTVTEETVFDCRGYLDHPDRWRCALYARHGLGHGPLSLSDALAQSCNTFFFEFVRQMGPQPLVEWCRRFGVGQATAIDLPEAVTGTLPTPQTIGRYTGRPWSEADTLALAIGQSALEVTPLQVARLAAAWANGGRLVRPHLLRGLGPAPDGSTSPEALANESTSADGESQSAEALPLAPDHWRLLRAGLEQVVESSQGTAHATVHLASLKIAGKTGTAQSGGQRGDHAWFAGYAPAEAPRVAVVVVLQEAGDGGRAAGPLARRMFERLEALGWMRRGGAGRTGVVRNLSHTSAEAAPLAD